MRWHYIHLRYKEPLNDTQENLLIVNWRGVRDNTAAIMEKRGKKLAKAKKVFAAVNKEAWSRAEVMEQRMQFVSSNIKDYFKLDKISGTEYRLIVSELVLGEEGKLEVDVYGRKVSFLDAIKKIADMFKNSVAKDQGILPGAVEYSTGMFEE